MSPNPGHVIIESIYNDLRNQIESMRWYVADVELRLAELCAGRCGCKFCRAQLVAEVHLERRRESRRLARGEGCLPLT